MANRRRNIKEAPIDYGDRPERMSKSIEDRLKRGETIFQGNPAIPSEKSKFTDPTGTERESSSIERLAADRFNEVVDKVREITGLDDLTRRDVIQYLIQNMMQAFMEASSIESRHRAELEELAVSSVMEEKNIPEGAFIFDAKLVGANQVDTSKMKMKPEEMDDEGQEMEMPNFDVDTLTDEENFELEKHKRTIINALIQGSAKREHFLFEKPSVREALNSINDSLVPLYKRIMAINDLFYWTEDEMIQRMSQTGMGVAGSAEVSNSGDGEEEGDDEEMSQVKIIARGASFPILTHELSKGIEEAFGKFGLPEDPVMAQKVLGQTDVLGFEPDQLRLGPAMVKKLRFALPDELFGPDAGDLMNWFKMELYSIEAQEFLRIMSYVLSENPSNQNRAKKELGRILDSAKRAKMESDEDDDDYDEYGSGFNIPGSGDEGPDDDIDLDDLLSGSGISLNP